MMPRIAHYACSVTQILLPLLLPAVLPPLAGAKGICIVYKGGAEDVDAKETVRVPYGSMPSSHNLHPVDPSPEPSPSPQPPQPSLLLDP